MRHVAWADDALDDLASQIAYIARDDVAAAIEVARRIRSTGDRLADFATAHPGRVPGTFEKTVARVPYIIVYRLSDDDDQVSILRVIHAARDWPADQRPD